MLWGGAALILVVLVLSILSFVAALVGEFDFLAVIGALALLFLIIPLIYVVVFGYYRVTADRRIRAAAEAYPGAYLLHVVMRPKVAGQWRVAAQGLGLQVGSVPWNSYAVFVADAGALRLFGGSFPFRERISLPTAALASVAVHPVTIGIRTLDCVVLGIADAQGRVTFIELLPVRWQGPLMRTAPGALLPAELAAMKAATHPGL